MDIEKFLKLLRGIPNSVSLPEDRPYEIIGEIFTNGNCYNFAFAVKALDNEIRVFTSNEINHAWFEYRGCHYDINGKSEHLKVLFEDGLATEIFDVDLSEGDMDNYSIALRGPMI